MQRLQFSLSWLQTTEVSFTSVLETEVAASFFYPPPHYSNPPIIIFWKSLQQKVYKSLDIDDKRYFHANKRLKVLWELRNKFAILKPDRGQKMVLTNHYDYISSLRKNKIQKVNKGSRNYKINNSAK